MVALIGFGHSINAACLSSLLHESLSKAIKTTGAGRGCFDSRRLLLSCSTVDAHRDYIGWIMRVSCHLQGRHQLDLQVLEL